MIDFMIGGISFREIRETSCYYADKTTFLEEFFSTVPPKVSLITRPRRFGKTLMMNMLYEFFDITRDSKAIFEGLAISKNKELCSKWMNQYPTVFITLKDVEGLAFYDALTFYADAIGALCAQNKYLYDSPRVEERDKEKLRELESTNDKNLLAKSLLILVRALHAHWGKPVIVLIDEYDLPLSKAQENGYYREMVSFIRSMLGAVLKDYTILQFGILTGGLRISKESIFSGLNNFACYGIADFDFADKFGFTSQEVDELLAATGCSAKKDEIKEWYDGYRFGDNKEIYCPWDILKYLKALKKNPAAKPKAYWLNSSGNDIVRNFVDHCNVKDVRSKLNTLMAGGCIATRIIEGLTYDRLYNKQENMWTVLYLSGNLTEASPEQMKKCGLHPEEGVSVLVIPNKEVLEIFASAIADWFADTVQDIDRTELFKAFWADDADALTYLLCDQMEDTLSYYDAREDFYHALLLGLFTFTGWEVESNREYGNGRPDLVLQDKANKRAAIIEIKRARSEKGLSGQAGKALLQIKKNRYAAPLLKKKDWSVSVWGMAFFKKSCVLRVEELHP